MEEIQIYFIGNLHNKKLQSSPNILIAVDKNGEPKRIKSDRGGAFISKEYNEFCKSHNINCENSTANIHTGTGLVERTIHPINEEPDNGKSGRRDKST